MRLLKSLVEIRSQPEFNTGYTFDFITDVEITSGWDVFTDTAKVTIPKRLQYRRDGVATEYIAAGDNPIFKRGDKITISVGYHSNPVFEGKPAFHEAFTGWITEVSPKRPMVILCEDHMYKLKQTMISEYESDGPIDLNTLLTALKGVADGFPTEITEIKTVNMNVGEAVLSNMSYAKFLDYLKRTYGLLSYLRGSTLYCGFANITQSETDAELLPNTYVGIEFGKDIIRSNNLNYKRKEDIRIKLTAYSILEDDSRLTSEKGDEYGDARNLYYYNIDQEALDKIASESVDKFKYDGFRGSMTIFGVPQVKHGYAVVIKNEDVPDQQGIYLVRQVKTSHGTSGSRQEIYLDKLVSNIINLSALDVTF